MKNCYRSLAILIIAFASIFAASCTANSGVIIQSQTPSQKDRFPGVNRPGIFLPGMTGSTPIPTLAAAQFTIVRSSTNQTSDILLNTEVHQFQLASYAGMTALKKGYIYWVDNSAPKDLHRIPLFSQNPLEELVVSSLYPDGSINGSNLLFAGDWLVFMDMPSSNANSIWKLRAHNLITGEDQIILDEPGDIYSWPGPNYGVNGDWVA